MKNGFSLIELMIVVAITATLASLAIPQYQNYLLRSHVMTEYSMAKHPIEHAIHEYTNYKGIFPGTGYSDLANTGFLQDDGNQHTNTSLAIGQISSVVWNGTHIILTFTSDHEQNHLAGKTIEIEAVKNQQGTVFNVSGGTLARHLLP